MRLLTSSILLSITVIAASCSKNQYAQVEPDDLYFTHKDRKEAVGGTIMSTSPTMTNVEPTETPTEYDHSEYSDRHSPVFTTPTYGSPTIQSPTLGSPTIQQNEQQPYYDTSVNPDYIYEEDYSALEGANSEYYNEMYAYQEPPVYETPQVNNYYYGMPPNTYFQSPIWLGAGYYSLYSPVGYSPYVYDPYRNYWDPFMGNSYASNWHSPYNTYAYNPWCDPFYPGYGNRYVSNNYWGSGWGAGYYGSSTNYQDTYYSNGTKVVTKPRQSRNQVSYEVDKSDLPIKTRRADYVPNSEQESGRIASTTNSRTRNDARQTSYTRRGNSSTYVAEPGTRSNATVTRRSTSTATIQRNNGQRTRTVVVPTRTKTSYSARNNTSQKSNSNGYNANQSGAKRSVATSNRSGGTTRYSTRTTNASRSSYGTRSSSANRSNASYGSRSSSSRSSSGTRSSYNSGRSSSRSYSAPTRSSGSSGRSYTPSRSSSSSSRSSGSRSSSSSSSGRSSTRKN